MPEPAKKLPIEKLLGAATLHADGTLTPKEGERFDPRKYTQVKEGGYQFTSNENSKGLWVRITKVGKKSTLLIYQNGCWYHVPESAPATTRAAADTPQTKVAEPQHTSPQADEKSPVQPREADSRVVFLLQLLLRFLNTKSGVLSVFLLFIALNGLVVLIAATSSRVTDAGRNEILAQGFTIAIMAGLGYGLVSAVLWFFSKEPGEQFERRGREMMTHAQAEAKANSLRKPEDKGIRWGKIRIPSSAAVEHFCVVGTIGSGKTLTLRMLMEDQLPTIRPGSDTRAMIYDAKSDVLPMFASLGLSCDVHYLNPFDMKGFAWNMAADINTETTAKQLAETIIPQEKEGKPFYPDAARSLLSGVITNFLLTRPGEWTFRDIILATGTKERLESVLRSHPQTRDKAIRYFDAAPETISNIMSTLDTKLEAFEPIAAAWDHATKADPSKKISIKDWLRSESILVLGNDETIRSTLDRVNQLFIAILKQQALAMSNSDTRRTWVFFDEFREAGELPGLNSLMLTGRSKGVSVVLGFQDIQGVRDVYGQNRADELVGTCANKALLRIDSTATAEWASSLINEVEYEENKKTITSGGQGGGSTSTTKERVQRVQVLPAEFMSMPTTNRENGLTGYYLIRDIGVYRAHLSEEEIGLRDLEEEGFYERCPPSWESMSPFTDADAKRLGINDESQVASHEQHEEQSEEETTFEQNNGLSSLGRMQRRQ